MAPQDPLDIVGQTILAKYRIEGLVGEGGFALVYRAQHTIWKQPVAIKFFTALSSIPAEQRSQFEEAFIREGALLTELSSRSPNIVQARDVGTFTSATGEWVPFLVLEWLDGSPLADIMDAESGRSRSLGQVLDLLGPVAAALDLAHRRGIAHRDMKPGNVFVMGRELSASDVSVKILDFGVAKMMSEGDAMQVALARTGRSVASFTPQYGAPEQFSRRYGATGPWTDVFALALIATELLTGQAALAGEDVVQLAVSAGDLEHRPTPRALGALVPDEVEAVFARALAVDPARRYARAGEFWSALCVAAGVDDPFARQGSSTGPTSAGLAPTALAPTAAPMTTGTAVVQTRVPSWRRSSWLALGLVAVMGFLAAGAWVGLGLGGAPAGAQPSAAPSLATAPAMVPSVAPVPRCPEGMVAIPGGQFYMGSDRDNALDNEKPIHKVTLSPFCMDLTEVTVEAYEACSDEGRCRPPHRTVRWEGMTERERKAYSEVCNAGRADRQNHPINCVDWEMSRRYCSEVGKRLPTEAEWEYATRGPDGRVYPWGDEAPTHLHLNACGPECVKWHADRGLASLAPEPLYPEDDGFATTAPVGSFPKGDSRFGPHDVVGNVWEWVADYMGEYAASDAVDPHGPSQGAMRVIRGGAYNGIYATWLRPSFRYSMAPETRSHGVGFRCVRQQAGSARSQP